MTIKELNNLGITPEFFYNYINENYVSEKIKSLINDLQIEFVDDSDYNNEIYSAMSDSYDSIPYFIVISTSWGEYYKATCRLSSYGTEDWSDWFPVTPREKLITYYE